MSALSAKIVVRGARTVHLLVGCRTPGRLEGSAVIVVEARDEEKDFKPGYVRAIITVRPVCRAK